MDGKLLEEQYAGHLSDYTTWNQLDHAEDHVVFPENIGEYLTIDETSLSQGELYTVVTNKAAKGNKGCLVAIIKGTDSERVKSILIRKIPLEKRQLVKEVTLDMAASMEQIVSKTFTKATLVTDRFHVQKLAYDAVQQMRIEYRWEALDQENKEIELSKELNKAFIRKYFGQSYSSGCTQNWNKPMTWRRNLVVSTRQSKTKESHSQN